MNARFALCIPFIGALLVAGACESQPSDDAKPGSLSAGAVKMNIVKGQTTQTQVVEAFGTPDLVTHKDGQDVWTYDKTSYEYTKESGYLTVIFAGKGGDRVQSSSRSTLLIIYFDDRDVVSDYRLSALKF